MEHLGITYPRGFETISKAQARRSGLISCLELGSTNDKALAIKLRKCRHTSPCFSAACPVCMRVIRLSHVANVVAINEMLAPRQAPFAITIVAAQSWASSKTLSKLNLTVAREKFEHATKQALRDQVWIGGIDISRNEENGQRYWQLHLQIVIWTTSIQDVCNGLRKKFKHTSTTPRPVHSASAYDIAGAASYTLKSYFVRRVNYRDQTGRRNTRKVLLGGPDTRELMSWLDEYQVMDRSMGLCICPGCLKKV